MTKRGRLLLGLVCVLTLLFVFATSAMASTAYGTLDVTGTKFGGDDQDFDITSDSTTQTLIIGASSASVTFEFTEAFGQDIEMYYGTSTKAITSYKTTVRNGSTYTFKFKNTQTGATNVVVIEVKYANTDIDKLYLYDDSGNELSYTTSSGNLFKLRSKLSSDVDSVTVNVLPEYDNATVYIDGKETRSQQIDLSGSSTSVEIRVEVEGITSVAYLLILERSDSSSSSDATLSSLYVTEGTLSPSFKSSTTSYKCSVPSSTSSVAIYTTTTEDNATVKIYQEGDLVSNTNKISLAAGSNEFRIVVTAPNFATKTYKLEVNRGGSSSSNNDDDDASSNAYLSDLTVDPSTGSAKWNKSFSRSTSSYTITIPEDATYVRVTPELSDSHASVEVDGEEVDDGEESSRISISANSTKSVRVVVTAEDGDTTRTYTLRISRGESSDDDDSSDADDSAAISTLILKNASTGDAITLSPAFSKDHTSYTVTVGSNVTAVKVKAVPVDSKATMTVNGVSLASNTDSGTMQLIVGTSAINVVVTGTDGTKQTYSIRVTRESGTTGSISLQMKLNSTTITNNGVADKMDAAPYLSNNRTMVPIRFVAQYLGVGEKEIKWDQTTKTATIIYNGKTLTMTVGKTDAAAGLDVAPEIKYNRTMVPLRYISEQLGCTVKWDQSTKEITITRE